MIGRSQLRFAIVGCGRMGRHHAEQLLVDGRGTVAALCDVDPQHARRMQRDLDLQAAIFESVDDLVLRGDVDAVILCSPTADHFSHLSACLDRGWHVLCEKPLATKREEIIELIRRTSDSGAGRPLVSLAYQRRYWSTFRTMRREIQSGRWGAVRSISFRSTEHWQATIAGTWRDDPRQNPGGYLADAGSHKLDMMVHLSGGTPRRVFAWTRTCGSHVEILGVGTVILGDDLPGSFTLIGNAQLMEEDWSVHCESADLLLQQDQLWISRGGERRRLELSEPHESPLSGFVDMLLLGTENLAPLSCALPVFHFCQAIGRSAECGQPVTIDEGSGEIRV